MRNVRWYRERQREFSNAYLVLEVMDCYLHTQGEGKGNTTGVAITHNVQAIVVQYLIMQYDNCNTV